MKKRPTSLVLSLLLALLILQVSLFRSGRAVATVRADSDLLVELPLDEGTGTEAGDVSGSGNDGTLVNGAAFEADSGDGSAFSVRFDGVDDRIDLGPVDVNGSGLTLATWFNADSYPGPSNDPRLISKASSSRTVDHVYMLSVIRSDSAKRLRARVRVGGRVTTLVASSGDLQTGVWQHAAMTYDGATLRLYLDGVEVDSTPLSGAVDVEPLMPVAVGNQPEGVGERGFDGLLDDVRILQRALSAEEVAAIAGGDPVVLPTAVDDGYSTDEDTPLVVDVATGVLANDLDNEPPDDLTVNLVSDVSDGILNLNADGSLDYTPNPDFSGQDSFTYEAVDGLSGATSSPATVTLTVNPQNDAPTAVDDSYQAAPGTALVVDAFSGVLANDSDPDLDTLGAVLDGDVSNGVLNLNADGSFDYTSNAGFSGQDSFTYYANDSLLDSNLATVTIVVQAPPTAVDDGYSTDEDTQLVVDMATGVLANDLDNEPPDDLTANLVSDVSDGILNLNADGSFDYTPNPDFSGQDSFTYEAVDGQSGATSSPATITLTVNPLNDAPTAVDDSYQALPEATLVVDVTGGVLANDSDPDLDSLQVVLAGGVSNGVLNLNADGSFDYTPNAGFSGQDSFTYYANDSLLDSTQATVTISVNGGDSDLLVELPLDEGTGTEAGDVSGSGNDGTLVNGAAFEADSGDGSAFSVRFDGVDDRIDLGPVDVNGSGLTLATWFNADSYPGPSNDPRLISKASSSRTVDHVYMLSVIRSDSAKRLRARVRVGGRVTTLVASSGDLQTGVWQHAAMTYDGATLRLYLDGVEVDSTPLSGAVDVEPLMPVAVGNQPEGVGERGFDGLLDDVRILQRALSAEEVAAIAGGDPVVLPTAVDDGYSTDEDTPLVVDVATGVLANDLDNEPPDDLTVNLVSDVSDGILNLNADGSLDYTPNPDFSGQDSFTYEAVDGLSGATSSPATVTLTVNPQNDAPTAVDDSYQAAPGTALVVDVAGGVLANDDDPDFDLLQAVLASGVSNGVLNLNADGSFDYTPNAGFSGQDSYSYYANDTLLDSNVATVIIVVQALPTAVEDSYNTDEDMALVAGAATGVLANDLDNEPPEDLTVALVSSVTDGVLNLNGDGSFDYTPDPNFNGQDSFTYEAVDGLSGAASSPATVTLTVNPLNDAPTAVDDNYQVLPETALVVDVAGGVLANDDDPESDLLQVVLAGGVSNGVLNLNADGSFDYTPNAGFSGQDSFTYYASDTLLDSNVATVTLAVGSGDNSAPQIVSGEVAFAKQVIATDLDETHAVVVADLNEDGFIDAVATDYVDNSVFWYENDGNGAFQTRLLDGSLEGAYPAHVGDVNLDGHIDILAAGYLADTFVWYESDGSGGFTRHDIDTAADGAHSIVTGDMDKDGDIDLLTSSQDAGNIAWYENDGGNNFTRHIIDTSANGAKRAEYADVDGDGDMDVFSASYFAHEVAWHENDGSQGFTKHIITSNARGAYFVSPADLNGDGNIDVLSASAQGNTIAWYENLGGGNFTEHLINGLASGARMVIAADVDEDGDLDAVSASVGNNTIAWYANNGNGDFTTHIVDLTASGAYGLSTADMDSDGNLDILSASRDAYEVAIHTQIRSHHVMMDVGGSVVIDDGVLLTVDIDDQPTSLIYTITDLPMLGTLVLNGSPIPTGGTLTQEDINSGSLTYVHGGIDSTIDGFSFTVRDGGGNGNPPVKGTFIIKFPHSGDAVAQLALDEGSGTLAEDVSGLGNDGTLVNGAVFESDSGDGSAYSVRFDGVDDRIDLGSVDVNGSGLTLAAWFKADSFPGLSNDPRLISKASGLVPNAHVFMLSTNSSGSDIRLRARVRVNGFATTLVASSGNLQTGVWQHAAMTYDGAMIRLYLDGVEVGSGRLSGAVDVEPLMPVAVGGQPVGAGERYFDGLLDDVRILQRALSAEEVAAITGGDLVVLPTAVNDSYSTDEDMVLIVAVATGLLTNDLDNEPPEDLTVTLVSSVTDGALNLNGDGSFDYTPDPNFNGQDSFTYKAVDGLSGTASSPATVTLTVNPQNDAPTAVDENYQALPETTLVVDVAGGVLANDSDPDLDSLQAVLASDVSNGILILNGDGSFDYTPNVGFSGQDSFTYYANDSLLDSNLAIVTLIVETPPPVAEWWDAQWSYRLPVTVDGAGFARTDASAEVDLNFTEVWASLGVNEVLDLNSLRVIELDSDNNILDTDVPFQFDPVETFDAGTNAAGTLTILLSGNTGPSGDRTYHIYFDDVNKSLPPAAVSPLVTVTDNVMDEGLTTYRIDNNDGTYYYDKQGGGFSSIVDANGNDWINYNTTPGSDGTFRGIPNLVYPEGYMHPGNNNVVSLIVHQGPLKITIRSTSNDNKWETLWEVYPDFARLTVLGTDHNYWFLYEGTPGGALDVNSDVVVRADGTQTLANEAWTGDLAGEEWVYFGDPVVGRSLYIANHQQDTAVDSYYAMNGRMTVFGFGRQGTNTYLNAVPATFTVGLVDDTIYGTVAGEIQAAYQPLNVTPGSAEVQ